MSSQMPGGESVFRRWLESLRESDPELYEELVGRLERRVATPESVSSPVSGVTLESASRGVDVQAIALETIVREGRPALLIRDNRIDGGAVADAAAEVILRRLREAAPTLEPILPLVGRIDVDNYPGPLAYVGTGWLVDRNIVVTNRHVADLIARADDGKFRFRPGRFGEDMRVAVDYRHEKDNNTSAIARVSRVVWIEPDPRKADIAFLEVDRRSDGVTGLGPVGSDPPAADSSAGPHVDPCDSTFMWSPPSPSFLRTRHSPPRTPCCGSRWPSSRATWRT